MEEVVMKLIGHLETSQHTNGMMQRDMEVLQAEIDELKKEIEQMVEAAEKLQTELDNAKEDVETYKDWWLKAVGERNQFERLYQEASKINDPEDEGECTDSAPSDCCQD